MLEKIPAPIESFGNYDQFIVYKLVPRGNGKTDKLPLNAKTGGLSNAHDPNIWLSSEDALKGLKDIQRLDPLSQFGLGFSFTATDPFWFVDIDGCIENGQYTQTALDVINMLPGAAIEISSSGTGLHIFGYGTPPEHSCKNIELGLEFYHQDRFVAFGHLDTMTGNAYLDYTPYLQPLVDKYFTPSVKYNSDEWTTEPDPSWNGPESNAELVKKMLKSKSAQSAFGGNSVSFKDLWECNVDVLAEAFPAQMEGKDFDRSSADASLAQRLAFWTGNNCERIQDLMWESGLARDKWTAHRSYLGTTIGRAKSQQQDFYKGGKEKTLENTPAPEKPTSTDGDGSMIGKGWDYFHIGFTDVKGNGKPKGNFPNFCQLIEHFKVVCRYNIMSKEVEISIPGANFVADNSKNSALATLRSLAITVEYPVDNLQSFALLYANNNAYHPVVNWIDSKPWDGVDRFEDMVKTLDLKDIKMGRMLIRKWAISALDLIYTPYGAKSSGVLVLQGAQNLGKTRWFSKLCGSNADIFKEGVTLNPADRDSVKQSISYWMVELGELDATFRKSDIAHLKSFITRDFDEFRNPFAHAESKYPRKTIFCATVNPNDYLHDPTGNRRFWSLKVGKGMNPDHNVDVQQFWAQIKTMMLNNIDVTWLRPEEMNMLIESNDAFTAVNPIQELLLKNYNADETRVRQMTATDVCRELQLPDKDARRMSAELKKFLEVEEPRRIGKGKVYDMPNMINRFANS